VKIWSFLAYISGSCIICFELYEKAINQRTVSVEDGVKVSHQKAVCRVGIKKRRRHVKAPQATKKCGGTGGGSPLV